MRVVSEIGDRLVVRFVQDAREFARIYDYDGTLHHVIDHVVPSMNGFADDRGRAITFYGASTLYAPRVYRLDVHTGESEIFFEPELDLDADNFVAKQVFFESKDGTRVPMFLLHRKDLELDGTNPVFMYAYGSSAWSAFPWQGHMLPWIEMGGVYAVPNIRGGGEYGDAWHAAGIRRNKQTGIDDFIAAGEWLIAQRYTSSERLVANGGSASGILPGAAIVQRPDLFGAAVINFPALDQVRYTEFGTARSWIPEFGDPAIAEDFQALVAYSPYHNIESSTSCPSKQNLLNGRSFSLP